MALTTEQMVKLEAILDRPTSYEIVLTGNGETYTLGMTARTSKYGLINAAKQHGAAILAKVGEGEFAGFKGSGTKCVWTLTNGWSIKFGRTERETIIEGEGVTL